MTRDRSTDSSLVTACSCRIAAISPRISSRETDDLGVGTLPPEDHDLGLRCRGQRRRSGGPSSVSR